MSDSTYDVKKGLMMTVGLRQEMAWN